MSQQRTDGHIGKPLEKEAENCLHSKILLPDELFPLNINKFAYCDAHQVVRTDLEILVINRHDNVSGFTSKMVRAVALFDFGQHGFGTT